jgi:hypothetical protein
VALRGRTLSAGIAVLLISAFLVACDVPPPFESSVNSPGAESARPPGLSATGNGSVMAERSGVAGGSAILWATDADRARQLDAIAATGARWFTMDIDWDSIQHQGPGTFWWDATDRLVVQARARGLRIIGVMGYSPAWARPADCPPNSNKCLPASAEPYADMARAMTERYGANSSLAALRGSINVWQVWNEPNHYPFVHVVDPARYTRILKRAYVSIKAVDPAATVLAGGTSPAPDDPYLKDMSPVTFLKRIYANGGQGNFDAFSHHPYSFPCSPLVAEPWNAFEQTRYLHEVMAQNGDGNKKIWGTESGAPTGDNVGPCAAGPNVSVTEAQQAQFVADYSYGWHKTFGSFTGPLIWFQIRDNGTRPMEFDDHFGLLRRDYSEKPAYRVFKRLILG